MAAGSGGSGRTPSAWAGEQKKGPDRGRDLSGPATARGEGPVRYPAGLHLRHAPDVTCCTAGYADFAAMQYEVGGAFSGAVDYVQAEPVAEPAGPR